jgi:hypothetical protein
LLKNWRLELSFTKILEAFGIRKQTVSDMVANYVGALRLGFQLNDLMGY